MTIRDRFDPVRIQLDREDGQTMAEYALLIALVAVLLIAAVGLLTGALQGTFSAIASAL